MYSEKFQKLYVDLDEVQQGSFARFNYRERMKLERTLFLVLCDFVPFDVLSFSSETKALILDRLASIGASVEQISVVEKIFDLRYFLRALSSGNPYEKYDVLYASETDRLGVFDNIRARIKKIEELIDFCH